MAKRVVEHIFSGYSYVPYTAYDSTKTVLGDLIKQYNGATSADDYAGPVKVAVARPNETSTAIPGVFPHVVRWASKNGFYTTGTVAVSGTSVTGTGSSWLSGGVPVNARIGFGTTDPNLVSTWYTITAVVSDTSITLQSTAGTINSGTSYVIDKTLNIDWVFLADNATAAATRRTTLFTFNRDTSVFTWSGYITHTYPTGTNQTIRGLRAVYKTYTTGTVAVSGATVTGTNTTWSADRIFIGCRIGFGSTDPTQISTWYYINAVTNDTSITIQNNVTASGTGGVASSLSINSGTAYVIEELIILHAITNATTTNGGLYMTNAVSFNDFASTGTAIAAAISTDKVKAVYWLADAATVTNMTACGLAIDDMDSRTQQYCYMIDGTVNPKTYKYNFRVSLGTITSGKTTAAFVYATGQQNVTGTLSQVNNGRIGTLTHGPGANVKSLYYATTTRIYRAPISGITNGSITYSTDSMVEVPTGGTGTYAATGAMSVVEIADQIDRLIVLSTGSAGVRSYVTKYNTNSDPFDHIFAIDSKQLDQSTADSNSVPHLNIQAAQLSVWSEAGLAYIARSGTASTTNQLYAVPLGADWSYASGTVKQRLITAELSTTNASKFVRCYCNHADALGSGNLTIPVEPLRIYYRTSGISDDSGSWTLVDNTGDLSSVTATNSIQFAIEFRTIGPFCLPARVYSLSCIYEDNTTDSHYQPSVGQSNTTSAYFAWRFATAFNGTVPTLRIRLYDAVSGGLLLDDTTTSSASGTWQKSTDDGVTWGSYDTNDKSNNTTYIRYTPNSIGSNIKVRALLTQN